jgi:hypothetical protein
MRLCSEIDCDDEHYAKGLCERHWRKAWKRTAAGRKSTLSARTLTHKTAHGRAMVLLSSARARSRQKGWPDPIIDVSVIEQILLAGHCEVSGLPFDMSAGHGLGKLPLAPSIDRPDSSLPYSSTNFRIVCWAVNAGLATWGIDMYLLVADAVRQNVGR